MRKPIADQLTKLVNEGSKLGSAVDLDRWFNRVVAFLQVAVGPDGAMDFANLPQSGGPWGSHAMRLGHLQGLIAVSEADPTEQATSPSPPVTMAQTPSAATSRKVFVVHGHDTEAKESTARFLTKLGLEPIILHEQPSSGRTIIEKFETYSGDIAFAVVLLTPDDTGGATGSGHQTPRARQNVIMELGYFIGRLGRSRVCALHKGGVELPSDYQGVVYVEMDSAGAWKAKIAQEFVQARLPIDLGGLLGG